MPHSEENHKKGLIAIPCYNEAGVIQTVVSGIRDIAKTLPFAVDIAVFDDASEDGSVGLVDQYEEIFVFETSARLGNAGNMSRIYQYADKQEYGVVFTFDGDGQRDPRNLVQLAEKVLEGYDSVVCSRYASGEKFPVKFPRRVGIFLYRLLLVPLGCGRIADPTSGNFAVSRPIIYILAAISRDFYTVDAALILAMNKASSRFCSIPGHFHEQSRKSMHDDLLWSIGSFAKSLGTVWQLRDDGGLSKTPCPRSSRSHPPFPRVG